METTLSTCLMLNIHQNRAAVLFSPFVSLDTACADSFSVAWREFKFSRIYMILLYNAKILSLIIHTVRLILETSHGNLV